MEKLLSAMTSIIVVKLLENFVQGQMDRKELS